MTAPQRDRYTPGQKVYLEAVLLNYNWAAPFGECHVRVPTATDPSRLLDGVDLIAPQIVVHIPGVHVYDLDYYTANEGVYDADDDEGVSA